MTHTENWMKSILSSCQHQPITFEWIYDFKMCIFHDCLHSTCLFALNNKWNVAPVPGWVVKGRLEEKDKNIHVVSSVPLAGRPSYLSQPELTDPKCFQMSSSSDLSPMSCAHMLTPPPHHPSAPWNLLTESPHGQTALRMTSEQLTPINLHIWSTLGRRQSDGENLRERAQQRAGWGIN